MRWQRIDDVSKGSKTMKEAVEDWQRARWIGNNNDVFISLDFRFLTVTLSCLYLFDVLF